MGLKILKHCLHLPKAITSLETMNNLELSAGLQELLRDLRVPQVVMF